MLESWKKYNGISVKFTEFDSVVKNLIDVTEEGDVWETISVEGSVAELMIFVDDAGKIQGALNVSMTVNNGPIPNDDATIDVKGIIEDGQVYFLADVEGSTEMAFTISLDELLTFVTGNMEADTANSMLTSLINVGSQYIVPLVQSFRDANTVEINNVVKFVVELVCSVEATDDGYVYTLDFEKIKAINEDLASLTISQLVDKYFGEGAYASIEAALLSALSTKMGDLPEALEELGIDTELLFTAINEIVAGASEENAGFDIEAALKSDEMKDVTVEQFITIIMSSMGGVAPNPAPNPENPGYEDNEDIGGGVITEEESEVKPTSAVEEGEPTAPTISQMISGYFAQFKDAKVYDLLTGGDPAAVEEAKTQINAMIDMIAAMVSVSFTTDAEGYVVDCSLAITLPEMPMGPTTKQSMNVAMDIVYNGTIDTSFKADLIAKVNALTRYASDDKFPKGAAIDTIYNQDDPILVDDVSLVPMRYYIVWCDLENSFGMSASAECVDYVKYGIIAPQYRYRADVYCQYVSFDDDINYVNRYYKAADLESDYVEISVVEGDVTVTVSGETLLAITFEELMDLDYGHSQLFEYIIYQNSELIPWDWFVIEKGETDVYSYDCYVNKETGEVSLWVDSHDWQLDESRSDIKEGCEVKSTYVSVCKKCGEVSVYSMSTPHQFDRTYSYSDGVVSYSLSCTNDHCDYESSGVLLSVPADKLEYVRAEGDTLVFTFTPAEDGSYIFYSKRNTDVYADPMIDIYDATGNYVSDDDDGGGDMNFSCIVDLKARESYEIRIYTRGHLVPFDVFVEAK